MVMSVKRLAIVVVDDSVAFGGVEGYSCHFAKIGDVVEVEYTKEAPDLGTYIGRVIHGDGPISHFQENELWFL
jgi:hypothetical protein